MSETRLEKYKKYRQSVNEFKAVNNEPESIKYRESSVVSDKMNTTSTLPLDEVLGQIEDQHAPKKILSKRLIKIGVISIVALVLIAGIIVFAVFAFGGK